MQTNPVPRLDSHHIGFKANTLPPPDSPSRSVFCLSPISSDGILTASLTSQTGVHLALQYAKPLPDSDTLVHILAHLLHGHLNDQVDGGPNRQRENYNTPNAQLLNQLTQNSATHLTDTLKKQGEERQ